MGLICWLPLTGTVENKGVSNITVTNNGATVDTNGKIGSCYSFNGNNYYISLVGQQLFDCFKGENQQFSMCMWVYHADSRRAILFGDWSLSNSIGFNIELSTGHGVRFYWNGSPDYSPGINVGASTWNHIAFTYDGTALRSYLNGSLIATRSGALAARSKTAGEFRLGRDNRTTDTALNGKLNDVRIYKDHCLSAAEVKEISQGLVLHYKLDGFQGGFGNPNLVAGSNTAATSTNKWGASSAVGGNTSTIVQDENGHTCVQIARDSTAQSSWDYLWYSNLLRNLIKTNTTYTVSFDCKPSVDGSISFTGFLNGNATNSMMASTSTIQGTCYANQWNHMVYRGVTKESFDGISVSGQVVYFSRSGSLRGVNVTVLFKNIKVEEGTIDTPWCPADSELTIDRTHIQDSSGYGHTGTNNNIKLDSNSSRYTSSIKFPENTSTITISPYLSSGQTLDTITINCWFKTNTMNSTAPNIFSLGENAFLRSRIASATSIWSYYRVVSTQKGTTYSCKTITDNTWHMLTFVFNKGTEIVYIDGSQIGTTNQSGTGTYLTCASLSWHLAGYTANSENFIGSLSDFRIYCTALSAEDILALYHTSAKVDNLQSLHARELIENQPTIKVTKQGQLKEGEIQEDTATKFYKSNQIITTNNLIEF